MNSTPRKLLDFLAEYRAIDDADLRADYLIEIAGRFREVPDSVARRPFPEGHRVPGCESQAFIWCDRSAADGPRFYFAIENPQGISAKAMAVILDETLSGAEPKEIAAVSSELVYDIFGPSISMGRGQGLMNMVQMVKKMGSVLKDD